MENTENPFRILLQGELEKRCQKNPNYSLRAFSRDLQISPSALSAMIRGKRKITSPMLQRLGRELGLPAHKVAHYQQQMQLGGMRFVDLEEDKFSVIADWYHIAILELMKLDAFQEDPRWIAKALGISIHEAQAAIERLQRVDILEIDNQGNWHNKIGEYFSSLKEGRTSEAARQFQKQIFSKARQAIRKENAHERSHTGMTMAINKKDLPKAIQEIRSFQRRMSELMEKDVSEKDEVYHLGISFFSLLEEQKLTKPIPIKEE